MDVQSEEVWQGFDQEILCLEERLYYTTISYHIAVEIDAEIIAFFSSGVLYTQQLDT